MVLFEKAGKYPAKTHIIMDNMQELEGITQHALGLVQAGRERVRSRLYQTAEKARRVQQKQGVIGRVKTTLERLELLRKMRDLRKASEGGSGQGWGGNEEALLRIPRSELALCGRLLALRAYMANI